jgi:excisionase family DNA binding protein
MQRLSAAEAAKRLGISVRRVQQLVRAGRLPAEEFGGAFVIKEKDLQLVANRRPGRPSSGQVNQDKQSVVKKKQQNG